MIWPYSNSVWSVGLMMMTPLKPSSSDVLAGFQFAAGAFQAHHRRDAQGPRHDGGVGGLAADVGGKTKHDFPIQLRRDGRAQIVADDDARLLEFFEIHLLLAAHQIIQDAGGDVPHVGGALAQVIVLNGGERGGIFLGDDMEGVLGVDLFVLDVADDFIQQRAVFQHQQMGVKDAAFLGPHAGADLALDFKDFLPGLDQRLFEPVDFLRQFRIGQFALGYGRVRPAEHKDLPPANSRRNGNAPENFLALVRRLWHGQSLHGTGGFEKSFLSGPNLPPEPEKPRSDLAIVPAKPVLIEKSLAIMPGIPIH